MSFCIKRKSSFGHYFENYKKQLIWFRLFKKVEDLIRAIFEILKISILPIGLMVDYSPFIPNFVLLQMFDNNVGGKILLRQLDFCRFFLSFVTLKADALTDCI